MWWRATRRRLSRADTSRGLQWISTRADVTFAHVATHRPRQAKVRAGASRSKRLTLTRQRVVSASHTPKVTTKPPTYSTREAPQAGARRGAALGA